MESASEKLLGATVFIDKQDDGLLSFQALLGSAMFRVKGGSLFPFGQSHEPWIHRSTAGGSTTFTLLLPSSKAGPSAEHERTKYSETRQHKVMCFKKSVHVILSFWSGSSAVWTDA